MGVRLHFFHWVEGLLFGEFLDTWTLLNELFSLGRLHWDRNLFVPVCAIHERFNSRKLVLGCLLPAKSIVIRDHLRIEIATLLTLSGRYFGRVSAMDQVECILDLHSISKLGRDSTDDRVFQAGDREVWEPWSHWFFRTLVLSMWEDGGVRSSL